MAGRTTRSKWWRGRAGRLSLVMVCLIGVSLAGVLGRSLVEGTAGKVCAEGRVTVDGETRAVTHPEGGFVSEILVSEGSSVRAGDLLLRIDIIDALARSARLSAELDALAARRARLEAERGGLPLPDFSEVLNRRTMAAESAVANQLTLFLVRKRKLDAARAQAEAAIGRLDAQRSALGAKLGDLDRKLVLTRGDTAPLLPLSGGSAASPREGRGNGGAVAGLQDARAALTAQLSVVLSAADETRHHRDAEVVQWLAAISDELAAVNARMDEIRPMLASERARIERGRVRAPVSGWVLGPATAARGAVIVPGQVVMRIAPPGAPLVVEAHVPAAEGERLREGMPAEVRLLEPETRKNAALAGRVLRVSEPGDAPEEEGHAVVVVDMPVGQEGIGLRPGMPARVVVRTAPRTVLGDLLSRLRTALGQFSAEA
jgi:HlyD family type I secretion membrane fusion protein